MPRRRPALRAPLWLVVTVTVAAPGLVAQEPLPQEPLPLMSVEVEPRAYGMASAEEIRRGRVSVAYAPEGPRLGVYYLRSDPVRPRVTYPDPPPTPEPHPDPDLQPPHTALWVWTTEAILREEEERASFLDFIEEQGITRVFLYLASAEGERPRAGYTPFSSEKLGPLLAQLRARGALAYALDGDRDYVLEENHAGVFRTVRPVGGAQRQRSGG